MRKKLWILRPLDSESGPWNPWYDKTFGFVVRATTEEEARRIASEDCSDEGSQAWLDNGLSSCVGLNPGGKSGIIIEDFHAA